MYNEIKLIEYSLEFHRKSSIALGNVKKYLKQHKYQQAMEQYKVYKNIAEVYQKRMEGEE